MDMDANVTEALRLIEKAARLIRGNSHKPTKNPQHFTDKDRLTPEGVIYLHGLFEQGLNPTDAGHNIGMHPSAARSRMKKWKRLKATEEAED
jgi:hypothetical protein